MRRLFIAEKPSAAAAIAEGIGGARRKDGYFECNDNVIVSYCIGHLFENAEPDSYLPDDVPTNRNGKKIWREQDLPIVPTEWIQIPKNGTRSQLKVLGELIKTTDEIVHAGDIDREGQAIVADVISYYKFEGPVKRFLVSAQDEVSIQRGLTSLKDNADFAGWRAASQARQRADWLVGMNITRGLTLACQKQGDNSLLVVGRVQSPTLALVVDRDEIIKNFKPRDYYQLNVSVAAEAGEFVAKWVPPEGADYLDDDGRIVDKEVAADVASALGSSDSGIISKYEKTGKTTPQPLGLALSDVTLVASNKFGMTADEVLKTVQSLYETRKLVSYPRSDCSYLPVSQLADAEAILQAIGATHPALAYATDSADIGIRSRIWNDKKVTAHHAIVPTLKTGSYNELSDNEKRIYDVIARSYVAQFHKLHEYDSTIIETTVGNDDSYLLRATGKTVTEEGWKAVLKSEESKSDESAQILPVVSDNEIVGIGRVDMLSKKTTPPKHYTEGSLIKALENIHLVVSDPEEKRLIRDGQGIGTPATRSAIISELKRRKYLEPKGKKFLVSTCDGQRLIKTLPEIVKSPSLTAHYEAELLRIQSGEGSLDEFINAQVAYVTEQVAKADESIGKAPPPKIESEHSCECGGGLVRRKGKEKGFWWGCSSYPACKKTYADKRGKPDLKAKKTKAEAFDTEFKCPACESELIKRKSAKGKSFWYGCSQFPRCKERFYDKGGVPDFG